VSDLLKAHEVRAAAVLLLKLWVKKAIGAENQPHDVLLKLGETLNNLEQEIMREYDIPGVSYWYHGESDCYFATKPYEQLGDSFDAGLCVEITRAEYLDKVSL